MTGKHKFIKLIYPTLAKITGFFKIKSKVLSSQTKAATSFYDLKAVLNNGKEYDFAQLKNKKVLIVNTASDCGYTPQYSELEKLYGTFKNEIEIIAFPANDFGEQEKADDKTIASFCTINFGVTFPLMQKAVVLKKDDQNNIFNWLTQKEKNGWNTNAPTWNFCKYLIDEKGNLTHFFESSVSPLGKEIENALGKK
jgi:glutathione peroxidase